MLLLLLAHSISSRLLDIFKTINFTDYLQLNLIVVFRYVRASIFPFNWVFRCCCCCSLSRWWRWQRRFNNSEYLPPPLFSIVCTNFVVSINRLFFQQKTHNQYQHQQKHLTNWINTKRSEFTMSIERAISWRSFISTRTASECNSFCWSKMSVGVSCIYSNFQLCSCCAFRFVFYFLVSFHFIFNSLSFDRFCFYFSLFYFFLLSAKFVSDCRHRKNEEEKITKRL